MAFRSTFPVEVRDTTGRVLQVAQRGHQGTRYLVIRGDARAIQYEGAVAFVVVPGPTAAPLTPAERSAVAQEAIDRATLAAPAQLTVASIPADRSGLVGTAHPVFPNRRIRTLWDPTELAAMARERDLLVATVRANQA